MNAQQQARIKAHLNLYAVFQNLEDLPRLDPDTAQAMTGWNVTIQFTVKDGPEAYLEFRDGACAFGRGQHPGPHIRLNFKDCAHLNAMFEGAANPSLRKGFLRIGFLKKKFTPLTERLEYFLKPDNGRLEDADYRRANTVMTLQTAVFAAGELAAHEPVSRELAQHAGTGVLEVGVLPDGPRAHVTFGGDGVRVDKGPAANPRAVMTFRNLDVAGALVTDQLDGFRAVAQGDVMLQGHVPMIDAINLIMDRVRLYLD